MDMRQDIFADQTYGQLALQKLMPVDPNFRLYKAGWMGKWPETKVMQVTGAVFRESRSGSRKGQLAIMVPGTARSAHVTAEEMAAFDAAPASQPASHGSDLEADA